jgi:hypothetical protein
MRYNALFLLLALCLLSQFSKAQQPSMSATTGLASGNTFTLFVTFQDPMPKIGTLACFFRLVGTPKAGQENFGQSLNCSGDPKREDDTHYSATVIVPSSTIAEGNYELREIDISIGSATRPYNAQNLPTLAPVHIHNSEHLDFSPIKKLETKP